MEGTLPCVLRFVALSTALLSQCRSCSVWACIHHSMLRSLIFSPNEPRLGSQVWVPWLLAGCSSRLLMRPQRSRTYRRSRIQPG
eukprot:jgi/Mesvir1/29549/Mv26187-RA.1